ncbi:aminopeptidase [Brevibacillus fluminis]|uniref:aminopeptidase n=1 Tax=Brevibacillus fluminis TaxID=511487 RepID=UPI003F892F03
MKDNRLAKIAENIVSYSLDVQPEERIMIAVTDEGEPLARELVRKLYAKGAFPYVRLQRQQLQSEWLKGVTATQANQLAQWEEQMWNEIDGYIGIHGEQNDSELSRVPEGKYRLYASAFQSIAERIDNRIKGVRLNYPNTALAQKAKMPTEMFEDFYFDVCAFDYKRMHDAAVPLYDWMQRTDRVRIVGPGTDVSFSIKGIGAVIAAGKRNIPDGEVYTAPVRDSINGTISYNIGSVYKGHAFEHIQFQFQAGKIVEATANHTEKLNSILDTDEGARYIGEFAIGFHPGILHPMGDTLFDEKIAGSFHLTPGRAYEKADNGNRSRVHWDLVSIQRPEYGGGEIWFDDVLIRKDGLFVPAALEGLNPQRLLG